MDKELKKKYDKSRKVIPLRLSVKEQIYLERMMKDEDWENASGFIKYKVFHDMEDSNYKKMIRKAAPEDIQIIMQKLMDNLASDFGYINYRFDYELERIEENCETFNERVAKKIMWTLGTWKKNVLHRTTYVLSDCEDILRAISIRVEREDEDKIHYAPDHIIDKARKDWNDVTSPEALEGVRRDYIEFHKKHEI